MQSDERLMEAVARRDLDAFDELVRRHQDSAWRIAYHYLKDPSEAEDVVQEVFLKILAAAPRYRPRSKFSTYLYRIIANLCLDVRRKNRPQYTEDVPRLENGYAGPDEALRRRERQRIVRRTVDKLPERQRLAVVLRYFEELSLTEIAAAMDTGYKSVERLLARARKSLAGHLADF